MLQDFIKESLKNRKVPYKWIRIGIIENNAQKRIEKKDGYKVSEIHIDNSGIIHTMAQAHHNLENDVLIFKQDINGSITFLAEVHTKNDYLLVFNAWRPKKARRDPDAAKLKSARPPGAYVQNESPSADT